MNTLTQGLENVREKLFANRVRHNARVIDYNRPATGRIVSISDCQRAVVIRWHNGRETEYSTQALTPENNGYRFGASNNGI